MSTPSSPTGPRKPVPKYATKTAEVLHANENFPHQHADEHIEEPSEKWLVSYADLMTLLFGFFVLMYSMSTLDQKKFAAAAQSASERFGGDYQDPTENLDHAVAKQIRSLPNASKDVEVKKGPMGLEINFRGKVLFESGQSELTPAGVELLKKVGVEIKKMGLDYTVRIEGHTDDAPISTPQFPSNWELSASRAIQVLKIFSAIGMAPKQLEAVGFADTRPIAQNRNAKGEAIPANMATNRRVMVQVQRIFQHASKDGPAPASAPSPAAPAPASH